MIYSALKLYQKLTSEKTDKHYFRGQVREYPGPLWPSAYRVYSRSADSFTISDSSRLRKSGRHFHFRTNAADSSSFPTEQEYRKHAWWLNRRLYIQRHITTVFGYPLGEVLCQQTGIASEGLDITRSVLASFFFALYDWNGTEYLCNQKNDAPSVIYRWHLDEGEWSLESLNEYDFYSCPPLIPAHSVLDSLPQARSQNEFGASLETYANAIGWTKPFDVETIRGRRPFHLLRMPREHLQQSRLTRQTAALLLPDAVTAEDFLARHSVPSEALLRELQEGLWIEDLGRSDSCERFYFDANGAEELEPLRNLAPAHYFPGDEPLFKLVRGWIARSFRSLHGVIYTDANEPMMSLYMQKHAQEDLESEFFI